jgi:hypothetical protein
MDDEYWPNKPEPITEAELTFWSIIFMATILFVYAYLCYVYIIKPL